MKIGFLTSEFPHPKISYSGGIGTSISNLCKGLIQIGHEVIVLVYGQDNDAVFHENGITFYKIKNVKFKGLSFFLTQKKIEKLINKLIIQGNVDLVEAPDWTGITSFINPKCPIVVKLHGSDTYFCHLDQRPVKWINKFREGNALKKADAIISVSHFTAGLTKSLFGLTKSITVIPNSIDVGQFLNDNYLKIHQNSILYFGTLIRKKGLLELPLIFNEVFKNKPFSKLILIGRDASDVITGNTSTWTMMQELFDEKAIQNVTYLGSVPHDSIKDHINSATVCVFPSFAEAFPVSWLEAMAMQKPIVASNVGWGNEVIDDAVNGFLVHPKNHKEFANKILILVNNNKLQNEFGSLASEKVELNFSNDIIAKKSLEFYKKTIDSYNIKRKR